MTRLRPIAIDWDELERLATAHGVRLQYRRARCEHGYTRDQTCTACEGGYVQDTSEYANLPELATLPNGTVLVAVSDDGEDVGFVSATAFARAQ